MTPENLIPKNHITVRINKAVKSAQNLDDIGLSLLSLSSDLRAENTSKEILFVSGVINAAGSRNHNRRKLWLYTEHTRENVSPWTFSAIDVFTGPLIHRIRKTGACGSDYADMFCNFIEQANLNLSGIVLTPNFELSTGAIREVQTAERVGLKLYDLRSELEYL